MCICINLPFNWNRGLFTKWGLYQLLNWQFNGAVVFKVKNLIDQFVQFFLYQSYASDNRLSYKSMITIQSVNDFFSKIILFHLIFALQAMTDILVFFHFNLFFFHKYSTSFDEFVYWINRKTKKAISIVHVALCQSENLIKMATQFEYLS